MKLLPIPELASLTAFLSNRRIGSQMVEGQLDLFTCKAASSDKKLSKQLQQQWDDEEVGMSTLSTSPLGPGSESSTRKLLVNLISTLNASFPDHDFSAVKPSDFEHDKDFRLVHHNVNTRLGELKERYPGITDDIWKAIDRHACLKECDIYSFNNQKIDDDDPLSDCLWSFNYFFVNKSKRTILFFSCRCKASLSAHRDRRYDEEEAKMDSDMDTGEDSEYEYDYPEEGVFEMEDADMV